MTIQRSGPTPAFGEYLTKYALIPKGQTIPAASPLFGFHQIKWVEIPSYQRGVAWNRENVEEFVDSKSILLGNVILGSFIITQPLSQCFPTGSAPTNYFLLVDGLQRFAVGTALISVLHPLVLDSNPSKPNLAVYFQPIINQLVSCAEIYLHNDDFMTKYPRDVVRAGYERIREVIVAYIEDELHNRPQEFGDKCVQLMLDRQIAIDEYFNFSSSVQLMNTFLGINTVRMDLSPVDLLRSHVVERAETAGWNSTDIETMENDFTEVFTVKGEKVRTELLPFVSMLLEQIENNSGNNVFPSWNTGLLSLEVDDFFNYITDFLNTSDLYVSEIRECGSIPFACLLTHYYTKFLGSGGMPTILSGGNAEWSELHDFIRGTLRAVIAGKIGKTRSTAEKCLSGAFTTLTEAGEEISATQTGFGLSQILSIDWLRASLELADKNRSKRIFNAMLLPNASHSGGTAGATYTPLAFGRCATDYHIDHLLPASMKTKNTPGSREVESIRNFAPLPQNQNRVAKATSCSTKLGIGGIYSVYAQGSSSHSYCQWLHSTQGGQGAPLDDQIFLERNAQPPIGDDRITEIATCLQAKL